MPQARKPLKPQQPSRAGELQPPARVKVPPLPTDWQPPTPGQMLFTCRAGFEGVLYEELAWAGSKPRVCAPGLVQSAPTRSLEPAFARVGFLVHRVFDEKLPVPTGRLAQAVLEATRRQRLCLQAWVPDTDQHNPRSALAQATGQAVAASLPADLLIPDGPQARQEAGWLGQLMVLSEARMVVGAIRAAQTLSLHPGGRQRMQRESADLSRAALKLEEALADLGIEPSRGDVCVDLGAAPGGWTKRLLDRGARVLAVDPAKLSPALASHPKVRHRQESAFAFEPEEPADWLFCDMAWRPLEVAQLLAKWGRRQWATFLVANLKLPMKDKNPVLYRAKALLQDAGWRALRVRQLYHDRDEVTLTARRGG